MKQALLFGLLWPSVACGQAVKAPVLWFGAAGGTGVQAQLIDFAPDMLGPYCGHSQQATVLQFRVLAAQGPRRAGDTLLVVIPCARESKALFVNGAAYGLRLHELATDPEWQQGWALTSRYEQRAWTRWWCRGMTRVE